MGFLDQLWGGLRNNAGPEAGPLPGALLSAVGGAGPAGEAHGVTTIISCFERAGLGEVARSWVSSEQVNQAVSPEQVHAALGADRVQEIAAKTGMPTTGVLAALAALLPQFVDGMTPNGEVPKGPADVQEAGRGGPAQVPGDAEASDRGSQPDEAAAIKRLDPTEPVQLDSASNKDAD